MQITIVMGPYLPVPPTLGGAVEKIFFALAKEFARRGHTVTQISRQFGTFPRAEVIEGVHHLRVPSVDAPSSAVAFRVWDLLYSLRVRRVLPHSDVTMTHSVFLPLVLGRQRAGKIYVHVQRYPKRQMWLYQRAARIQTVSTAVARAIVEQTPRLRNKVCVIRNPLTAGFSGTGREVLATPRQRVLLYIGRIHPEKGVHLLIEAFHCLAVRKMLRDWRLVIVGPWQTNMGGGGPSYRDALSRLALKLGERCTLVGPVFEQAGLMEFYRSASLFVYPTLAEKGEALPIAPLEALAMGCPALVSSLECFTDYLRDGETGFIFDYRSADPSKALACKIAEIVNDPERIERVRHRGFEQAQKHTIEAVANEYLADFASLCLIRATLEGDF